MTVLNTDDFMKALEECMSLEGTMKLPDEFIKNRPALLMKLNRLMHYKLTVEELNDSLIFLMNLMLGNQPKLAFQILPYDTIRMPFAMLDKILPTKGKLTREERLVYAFCIAWICGFVTNEAGIYSLLRASDDDVIKNLIYSMKTSPEKFEFLHSETNSSYPFGITIENPIKAVSINAAYKYLQQLRTLNNEPVIFERLGSGE